MRYDEDRQLIGKQELEAMGLFPFCHWPDECLGLKSTGRIPGPIRWVGIPQAFWWTEGDHVASRRPYLPFRLNYVDVV